MAGKSRQPLIRSVCRGQISQWLRGDRFSPGVRPGSRPSGAGMAGSFGAGIVSASGRWGRPDKQFARGGLPPLKKATIGATAMALMRSNQVR